jgi:hypothetical protein
VVRQVKIFFTDRQLRFMAVLARTGVAGTDRSDIVRRAVDAQIQAALVAGLLKAEDGGPLEPDATEEE